MEWQIKETRTYKTFSEFPNIGEEVWVDTSRGIFKAKYDLWDWSSSPTHAYFNFEGKESEIIAWIPHSDYQPERSKREDSGCSINCHMCYMGRCCNECLEKTCKSHNNCKLEMRCSEHERKPREG